MHKSVPKHQDILFCPNSDVLWYNNLFRRISISEYISTVNTADLSFLFVCIKTFLVVKKLKYNMYSVLIY